MKNRLLFLIFATFFAASVLGNSSVDNTDFHSLVINNYSFLPSKLNKEEREAKSKAMDSFWSIVSADRVKYLPKLREELNRKDNPIFFYYDGAKLLLSLSNEIKDKQLAVASIARTDLSEVQSADYVRTIMKLGAEGIDTSGAAFRILDYPTFTVQAPVHALTLGQNYSLILMLYRLPEQQFLGKSINRLLSEKNITSQKSLLEVLWYSVTPIGDETITKISKDKIIAQEVRDFAVKLLENTNQINAMPASAIEKIRQQINLEQTLLEVGPILAMKNKEKQMSKTQIDTFKRFLKALRESEEKGTMEMLKSFAKNSDRSLPQEISEYAEELIKNKEKSVPLVPRSLSQNDVAELKKVRQNFLISISDEAFEDFTKTTMLIRWAQKNGNR